MRERLSISLVAGEERRASREERRVSGEERRWELPFEYACHEGNYAMRNILGIARAEEKAK